jgi:hypothetical protein
VSRPKPRSLCFELLETRCLLNGTLYGPNLFAEPPDSAVSPQWQTSPCRQPLSTACAQPRLDANGLNDTDVTAAGADTQPCGRLPTDCVGTGITRPLVASPDGTAVVAPTPVVVSPNTTPVVTVPNVVIPEVAAPEILQVVVQSTIALPVVPAVPGPVVTVNVNEVDITESVATYGGEKAVFEENYVEITVKLPQVYTDPTFAVQPTLSSSPPAPVVKESASAAPINQASAQVTPPAKDSSAQPVKDQTVSVATVRDQTVVTVVPVKSANERVSQIDRLTPPTADATGARPPALQAAPATASNSVPGQWNSPTPNTTAVYLSTRQTLSAAQDAPVREPDDRLADQVVPSATTPPTVLWTNVFPVDMTALDNTVKDFFEHIDQFGVKLSANQVELLFSSSLALVAAGAAAELIRRKSQARVPALVLRREGTIPYSSYP